MPCRYHTTDIALQYIHIGDKPVQASSTELASKVEHSNVYQSFESGNHVVRGSDHLWLTVNLIIELVLMRSIKTCCGITRGITEQQRLTCLFALPACFEVNDARQELTGVNFNTGENNKNMTNA
ncbi:hypothetical protein MAR_032806 [Mya arenaria]|uniref:Uncharacterized protein n=1 Tax=Mya arenaria TaxID=6604 RepID=A0ABY7GAA0_MYAAR|nr:hypothetical protein MAR_032806 [Mya arenaria]